MVSCDIWINDGNCMKKKVIGFGEILWDMLPDGRKLGGAPANFAYHSNCLGCEGWVVSSVGKDKSGDEIKDIISRKKFNACLGESDRPTGTVNINLDAEGIPSYEIVENVAWDDIVLTDEMKRLASEASALCFGSLVQRNETSRKSLYEFIGLMPDDALKIYDINLRQNFYDVEVISDSMEFADILKINDEELKVVSGILSLTGSRVQICRNLLRRYSLKLVILTKGKAGSDVVTEDSVYSVSPLPVKVVDTVGAGDSFTATFVACYLSGNAISECHRKASAVSSYVCSCKGAMPEYSKELAGSINL